MFPGAGAVSERVPQETGIGKVGGSPVHCARFYRRYSRRCSGTKSPISHIMRVLFQDYGLASLRRAALLARKLVRSSVQRNEYFALDLAERSLPRFFFRYFNIKSEFAQIREMYGRPDMADVDCMAELMKWRLSRHRALPEEALRKHHRLNALTAFYTRRLQTTKKKFKRPADREAFLLNCLVEYELKQTKQETWQFSAGGLAEMQEDFTLLSDYESVSTCRISKHR